MSLQERCHGSRGRRLVDFSSERRFFASRRRSTEPRVGFVFRRGGGGGASSSPSSKFSPATYSDGPSSSGEKSGGEKSGGAGRASSSAPTSGGGDAADVVPVAQLPAQARATLKLIDAGGPFPYSRDGIVFANREGRLPKHPRGWYHEYTVETPGESDRGARRLIQGQDGTIYYTGDHYESFRRVQR